MIFGIFKKILAWFGSTDKNHCRKIVLPDTNCDNEFRILYNNGIFFSEIEILHLLTDINLSSMVLSRVNFRMSPKKIPFNG